MSCFWFFESQDTKRNRSSAQGGSITPVSFEILVWERQIASQTANIAPQRFGKRAEDFERRIALSPFHSADVTWRYVTFQSEILLRDAFDFARLTNSFTQNLQRNRFLQP